MPPARPCPALSFYAWEKGVHSRNRKPSLLSLLLTVTLSCPFTATTTTTTIPSPSGPLLFVSGGVGWHAKGSEPDTRQREACVCSVRGGREGGRREERDGRHATSTGNKQKRGNVCGNRREGGREKGGEKRGGGRQERVWVRSELRCHAHGMPPCMPAMPPTPCMPSHACHAMPGPCLHSTEFLGTHTEGE